MSNLVLAFDIEHSGTEVIAIGASVVDSNFKQLDSFFFGAYDKKQTKFSDRCWNTFWQKYPDVLRNLQYQGPEFSRCGREKEMITDFQNFRIKWEVLSKAQGLKLVLVTDNNVFDGGLVNELIKQYLPGMEQIPYSASVNDEGKQEYCPFWETFSQQKGLLSIVDPTFDDDWGFSDKIFELYNVQRPTVKADHNPVNDAYNIAYDQHVLLGIKNGSIILKPKKIDK